MAVMIQLAFSPAWSRLPEPRALGGTMQVPAHSGSFAIPDLSTSPHLLTPTSARRHRPHPHPHPPAPRLPCATPVLHAPSPRPRGPTPVPYLAPSKPGTTAARRQSREEMAELADHSSSMTEDGDPSSDVHDTDEVSDSRFSGRGTLVSFPTPVGGLCRIVFRCRRLRAHKAPPCITALAIDPQPLPLLLRSALDPRNPRPSTHTVNTLNPLNPHTRNTLNSQSPTTPPTPPPPFHLLWLCRASRPPHRRPPSRRTSPPTTSGSA